jgi:hypothetical protein
MDSWVDIAGYAACGAEVIKTSKWIKWGSGKLYLQYDKPPIPKDQEIEVMTRDQTITAGYPHEFSWSIESVDSDIMYFRFKVEEKPQE